MASSRTLVVAALVLGLVVATGAAVRQRAGGAPPVAAGLAGALPDLTVLRMHVELETGGSCGWTSTTLGVTADIANTGGAGAGPFVLEVNGARRDIDGLAAGAEASNWFAGYAFGAEQRAVIDVTALVAESDEENNVLEQLVPIPTLPPTCTPTRTPTATPTATPIALAGDVDCNGRVDAIDAALVLQLHARLIASLACQTSADVNGDGETDSRDALLILQSLLGVHPPLLWGGQT